ncbi:MAG: metallophosphoesterase [Verrucomicrobiota bacterium JB022]|nr:metallophosphoesterase [Verrucomicrobiota bacterium JB022]
MKLSRSIKYYTTLLGALALPLTLAAQAEPMLLTDPFLQLPTESTINVVWFTEFEGSSHTVEVGDALDASFPATTTKLSRVAEDGSSWVKTQDGNGSLYSATTERDIWRHEATVTGLNPGQRVPYRVVSVDGEATVESETYSLAPVPPKGQPLKILMTSDHQLKAMTPANLQKVVETVGMVDAVFYAGDLQNIPDRASEWFDDNRGFSYFAALQGRVQVFNPEDPYTGGAIIQNAPLFPVIGNHEVMGKYDLSQSLGNQFNFPQPRWYAEKRYEEQKAVLNPSNDPTIREEWITNNSFNSITYEEIFSLPADGPDGEKYYSIEFGDVFLMGLYTTRIWRSPTINDNTRGKYSERVADYENPDMWGFGDFLFWDFAEGSAQYDWFAQQLESEAYQNAAIRYVLTHQTSRGTGDNVNPLLAEPVQTIERGTDGEISFIKYEYPPEQDVFHRDLHPLIEAADVDIVHFGHSHLWVRLLTDAGVNYIETSNVGNNYGSYIEGYKARSNAPRDPRYEAKNYFTVGDPWGAEPIMPTIAPVMQNPNDATTLPTIDSNSITVFSILDTATQTVSSYYFDTAQPESAVVKFDEFSVLNQEVGAFSLDQTSAEPSQQGGSYDVAVTANPAGTGWTASTEVSWISFEGNTRQYGDGTVRLVVAENPSTEPRQATVLIGGQEYTVTQAGLDVQAMIDQAVNAATEGVTLPAPGSLVREMAAELALPITTTPASLAWMAEASADWLTLPTTSGTGETELTIQVAPNEGAMARAATVTINDTTFMVVQAGSGELGNFFGGLSEINSVSRAYSPWLGSMYLQDFPWVFLYDSDIGWSYWTENDDGGYYFVDQGSGEWLYTSEAVYPWVWGSAGWQFRHTAN